MEEKNTEQKREDSPKVEIIKEDLPNNNIENKNTPQETKKPKKRIKWGSLITVVVILLLIAIYFIPFGSSGSLFTKTKNAFTGSAIKDVSLQEKDPNAVLAMVNQEKITQSDLDLAYEDIPLSARSSIDESTFLQEVLIPGRVIRQEADSLGINTNNKSISEIRNAILTEKTKDITASNTEITNSLNNVKKQVQESSDLQFEEVLSQQGITLDQLKENLAHRIKLAKYFNISVTEDEINSFFEESQDQLNIPEQRKASHILICFEGKTNCKSNYTEEAARNLINEIKTKLDNSENFSELAKEYSSDGTAQNGGDLGYFAKEQMVPEFGDTTFSLEKGQISDVIETDFGFHLIKLDDLKEGKVAVLSNLHDQIEDYLTNQKITEKTQEYIDELVNKSDIETF